MMNFAKYIPEVIKTWGMFILLLGVVAAFTSVIRTDDNSSLFLYLSFAFVILLIVKIKPVEVSGKASIFVFFLACVSIILWGLVFNSGQVSDFGVYYRCGIGAGDSDWMDKCQSAYLGENSTYWTRSYFYSSVIGRLFGDKYIAFKLSNALLHCATLGVWYFGVRKYYGFSVAAASAVLLAIFPEYWFSTTLVTTDNAAVLAVALFLLLLPKSEGRTIFSMLSAIAIGLIIFFGNQLRSAGSILIIALAFWMICDGFEKRRWSAVLAPTVAVISYFLVTFVFDFLNPVDLPNLFNPIKIISAVDFHTAQDFSVNYYWAEHFWSATPEAARIPNAIYKVMTEFSSGFVEWPLYLFRKAVVIFSGYGYYGLSSFKYPSGNPDSLVTDVVSDIPFSVDVFPWLSGGMFVIMALAVVGVLRTKLSGLALCSVLFLGAFGLIVVGMGEAQPRYSVMLAPALSLLAALAIFPLQDSPSRRPRNVGFLYGSIGLIFVYLIVASASELFSTPKKITEGTRIFSIGTENVYACDNKGVSIDADYKKVRINFLPTSSCASISIPVKDESAQMGFYLSGSKFPFKFEDHPDSLVAYRVFSAGSEVISGNLGGRSVDWIEVPISRNSKKSVVVLLYRGEVGSSDYLDISLIRETVD